MPVPPRRLILLILLLALLRPFPAQAAPVQQTPGPSTPVYGVIGHFERVQGQPFPVVFVASDGTRLSSAGATAQVQQQIDILTQQQPAKTAQVWGTRNYAPKPDTTADLVVTQLLVEGDTAAPAPAPANLPTAVVNFSMVNLYSTPAQSPSVVGQARAGEQCTVKGRDPSGAWLLVDCGSASGWVDKRLVAVNGDLTTVPTTTATIAAKPPVSAPTPTPVVTPPPMPAVFNGWRTYYFNNANLQGNPVAYADSPEVNFNWNYGSPNPAVPVDYFSARFDRTITFPGGTYEFKATADDGVRVYLDNDLLIDEWHGATNQTYSATRSLSGAHQLRVDFLELVGIASVRFWYESSAQGTAWNAYYYNSTQQRTDLLAAQSEPSNGSTQLQRNWGYGAPVQNRVPSDGWNGRWQGEFDFSDGDYVFRAATDDGVRVYIDDTLVLDAWREGPVDITNTFRGVGGGKHRITVDYYKRTGNAYLQVWWYRSGGPTIQP